LFTRGDALASLALAPGYHISRLRRYIGAQSYSVGGVRKWDCESRKRNVPHTTSLEYN